MPLRLFRADYPSTQDIASEPLIECLFRTEEILRDMSYEKGQAALLLVRLGRCKSRRRHHLAMNSHVAHSSTILPSTMRLMLIPIISVRAPVLLLVPCALNLVTTFSPLTN